ncbi:GreA/GreB family elongation factor [Paenibacillus aurantius]|uniref:GreA/GreB family elongation factor n=1 Tax=Paenibacillus aurantius TaxID=2918900 RepID=A0AA96LFR3_9BACL|nr:GreA/GreB family elongation factor [Paenibacillus aurantius]WNQ13209.1 GreA/GreB family elongation factor [Paenibacillus aurantius]
MSHSLLTPAFKEALIRQLVYFDENRHILIDPLATYTHGEKKDLRSLLLEYEKRIEKLVAGFEEDLLQSRILIGSTVVLQFEGESTSEIYKIVLPDELGMEENRISCLSPLGRGLLLAKCGDPVTIRTPQGDYSVTVLANEYEEGMIGKPTVPELGGL